MPSMFRVLTLNTYLMPGYPLPWIPFVPPSQSVSEQIARIDRICQHIEAHRYDFVCLQEVWTKQFVDYFINKLFHILPFSAHFSNGFLGSTGLLTLSKHPITSTFYKQYQLNDVYYPLGSVDSVLGKGIGVTMIECSSCRVALLNTHTQSEKFPGQLEEVLLHQIWELSTVAAGVRDLAEVTIVCGDLNLTPASRGYDLLQTLTGLQDSFTACNGRTIHDKKATYACPDNELVDIEDRKSFPEGLRFDYIFFGVSSHSKVRVVAASSKIRPWGNEIAPVSDHEPVDAAFAAHPVPRDERRPYSSNRRISQNSRMAVISDEFKSKFTEHLENAKNKEKLLKFSSFIMVWIQVIILYWMTRGIFAEKVQHMVIIWSLCFNGFYHGVGLYLYAYLKTKQTAFNHLINAMKIGATQDDRRQRLRACSVS